MTAIILSGLLRLGLASALVTEQRQNVAVRQIAADGSSTASIQEFFDDLSMEIDALEGDADKGPDLGMNLVIRRNGADWGTEYVASSIEKSSLCDYCAGKTGTERITIKVGQRVMADWEDYGAMYPGVIIKAYPDGTYKIDYDDGFIEDHVTTENIQIDKEDEKKQNMKKVGNDPACKFQDLVEKVKPKIQQLEKDMAMWCQNQRANIAGSKAKQLPPPPKRLEEERQAAAIKGAGDGQLDKPSGLWPMAPAPALPEELEPHATEIAAMKNKIAENDAYIEELKQQEEDQALRLEEYALEAIKSAKDTINQGVKTVDVLLKEYSDRIAAQEDEIALRLKRIQEQAMELAKIGAHHVSLEKIEAECSNIEDQVKDAWAEMKNMDMKGELDPDLKRILEGVMAPIRNIRSRVNHLMGLKKATIAKLDHQEDEVAKVGDAAKQLAIQQGKNAQDAAEVAKDATKTAQKALTEELRADELVMLQAAQSMTARLRKAGHEAQELDIGLIPRGDKWWRYRYEHAYVEAWIMICVSILMLLWRKFVQEVKYRLEIWALPAGTTSINASAAMAFADHPGRDDGSLFLVWLSCLAEMMLTCILVFITIWVICKTTLVDLLPFAIKEGDMNAPVTGDQYRRLAVDCSSIYFFAILMYFMLIFPIAHDAKRLTHKIAREFDAVTPREDVGTGGVNAAFGNSRSMAAKKVGTLANSKKEFQKEREWFCQFMAIGLADRTETEAVQLKDMFQDDWESFPLTNYLIMSVHINISSIFEFLWKIWLPFVISFVLFAGLHRFWHMGYVRIMGFFTAVTLLLLLSIGWYTNHISKLIDQEPEDVKKQTASKVHLSWHTETIVLKALQFALFFQCYGVARMICHPWMWELHFWPVLSLTILACVLGLLFSFFVSPTLPSFCAVMAMPPYLNPHNFRVMLFAAECAKKDRERDSPEFA